jgi:hypothetical protein
MAVTSGAGAGGPSSFVILMKFLTDEASKRKAEADLASIINIKNPAEKAKAALQTLDDQYVKLAADIKKIKDPQQRDVFAQRVIDLQKVTSAEINAVNTTVKSAAATKRASGQIAVAYDKGAQAVQDMDKEVRNLTADQQEGAQSNEKMIRWGLAGFATMRTGRALMQVGKAILSPIEKFAEVATKTDPVFAKWEQASNKMSMSFARIGRVMMREALPAMQKIADLAEQVAKYAEAHPEVAKAAVVIGGVLTALGAVLVALGQVMVSVVMFKGLLQGAKILGLVEAGGAVAGGAAATATTTAGTAAALGGFSGLMFTLGSKIRVVIGIITTLGTKLAAFGTELLEGVVAGITTVFGAILGGVVAGFGVNEMLSKTEAGKKAGIQPFGKIATVAAYGAGSIFGKDTAEEWAKSVATAFGYIKSESDKTTESLDAFGDAFDLVAKDATELYKNYIEAEDKAKQKLAEDLKKTEDKYEEERLKTIEKYGKERSDVETKYAKDRVDIEADYEKDRTRLVEDFARDSAQRQADYLRDQQRDEEDFARDTAQRQSDHIRDEQRLYEDTQDKLADLEGKYNDDVEKARKDHLKNLEKLERDHQYNVMDLVATRDEIGLVMERRRYAKEIADEEDAYNNRLEDLNDNLAKERAQIQADYQQRLQEMNEEFAIEEQRRQEDFALKQAEQAAEYELESQRRLEDHQLELDQLKAQEEEKLKQLDEAHKEKLDEMAKDYEDELSLQKTEKAKQLADLKTAYNTERQERSNQLKQEMSDLLNISQEGYAAMEEAARKYADSLLEQASRLGTAGSGSANTSTTSNPTYTPKMAGFTPTYPQWYLNLFKASGGYSRGVVVTGEEGDEYILNRDSTLAAERLLGSKLTQANILRGLAASKRSMVSGAAGGRNVTVSNRIDFHGALSADERAALRKEMHQVTAAAVIYAMEDQG